MTDTPFDAAIAEIEKTRNRWSSLWKDTAGLSESLATLYHHRAAWLASQSASLTPPAGESVGEQMRARGWEWVKKERSVAGWEKRIGRKVYAVVEYKQGWIPYVQYGQGWLWIGSDLDNHNQLTAVDACERHAGKEQRNG